MPKLASMGALINRRVIFGTGALVVGTWLGRRMLARQAQGGVSPERKRANDPQEVAAMVDRWREAIDQRDFSKMKMIQRVFLMEFERYAPSLEKLALSDPDARVREVSTSVLGRFGTTRQVPVFQTLLADESARVRNNAAWALRRLGRAPSAEAAVSGAAATAAETPSGP